MPDRGGSYAQFHTRQAQVVRARSEGSAFYFHLVHHEVSVSPSVTTPNVTYPLRQRDEADRSPRLHPRERPRAHCLLFGRFAMALRDAPRAAHARELQLRA